MKTFQLHKSNSGIKTTIFTLLILLVLPMSLFAQCPPVTNTVGNSSCTPGASLTLTATTYGYQYLGQGVRHRWYTSATGSSYVQDVATTDNGYVTTSSYTANFSSTTSYWVAAYKSGCGMSSRRQVTATITSGTATISPSRSPVGVCSEDDITLTANSGTGYQWYRNTTNNISTATQVGTSRTYDPTIDSYYWVKVNSSSCGWTTSSSIQVTFNQALTPSVSITKSPSGSVCPGTSVTLTAVPSGTSNTPTYSWTIGGSNYTTNPVNYTVNSNTSVSLTMTSTDGCVTTSTANASSSLAIYPYPTSGSLQGTGTYCSGGSATMSVINTQSGYKYYLYRGVTLVQTVTGTGGTVNFNGQTTEGTYTLKGSHASCTSDKTNLSGSVEVELLSATTVALTSNITPVEACIEGGLKLTATASRTIQWVTWKRGTTTVETDNSSPFEYTPDDVGTYTYWAEMSVNNGCGSYYGESRSIGVTLNDSIDLNVTVSDPDTICPSTNTAFTATVADGRSSLVDYQWYVNDSPLGSNSSSYSNSSLVNGDVVKCMITQKSSLTCAAPTDDDQSIVVYNPSGRASASTLEGMRNAEGVVLGVSSPNRDMTYYLYQDGNGTAVDTKSYAARNTQTGMVEFAMQSTETGYSAKATLAQCSSIEHSVSGSVTISAMGYYPPVEINAYARSLSSGENYTRVVAAKESGYSSGLLSETDPNKISETVEYYDGLGRSMQTVSVSASPTGKDLVKPVTYDEYGRNEYDFLPYAADNVSGSNGSFRDEDWFTSGNDQEDFYQDHLDIGSTDPYAYALTIFEESPINRVLAQGAPGSSWQPSGADGLSGHTARFDYSTNTSSICEDVRLFIISSDTVCSSTGFYDDEELFMNVVYSEDYDASTNDDAFTVEYKDKLGRVVLKDAYLDAESYPLRTYYIYDDFGLLRFVFPPEFSDSFKNSVSTLTYNPSSTGVKNYCFYYAYDSRNRMIEKQLPGALEIYMVYDHRDRLVGTQDGNLREDDEWVMTKYDILNRPVITARMGFSSAVPQSTVQGYITTFYNNASNEEYEEFNSSGIGYTDQSYPDLSSAYSSAVLTVTFYDSYDFLDLSQFSGLDFDDTNNIDVYTDSDGSSNGYFDFVRGQVTGTTSLILDGDDDTWIHAATYYDDKYRAIQTQSELYPDGELMASTKYDFIGTVLETLEMQTVNSVLSKVQYKNSYDHANRLTESRIYYNANDSVLLANNIYDELGQLEKKNLHSENSGNFVQSFDYDYSIRGWLTAINDPESLGAAKFGMKLFYDTQPSGLGNSAMYNGNISGITWAHNGSSTTEGYVFDYDELNRLAEGDYKSNSGSWTDPSNFGTSYLYDLNGNITDLTRNNSSGSTIDNLSYGYLGNRLDTITDSSTSAGFNDTNSGVDYAYDANGNMNWDKNKDINSTLRL